MLARIMSQGLGILIGQNEKQSFDLNWTKITMMLKISLNPGEKNLLFWKNMYSKFSSHFKTDLCNVDSNQDLKKRSNAAFKILFGIKVIE